MARRPIGRRAVSAASGWPVRPQIGYPTPGSLGSWLGIDRGIPILTLELPAGPLASFRAAASAALDGAVNTGKITADDAGGAWTAANDRRWRRHTDH